MRKIRYLFGLIVLLSIGLFSCVDKEIPVDEGMTFNVTKENIESFYDINVDVNVEDGTSTVDITITQTYEGTPENIAAVLKVYTDVTFEKTRELVSSRHSFVINESIETQTYKTAEMTTYASIFYVEIVSASGKVKTTSEVQIENKQYELPEYTYGYDEDSIVILDPEGNEERYDLLMDTMDDFTLDVMSDPQYLQMHVLSTSNIHYLGEVLSSSESTSLKMKTDGSYIEQIVGDINSVIKYEHDRYFVYEYGYGVYPADPFYINPYVLDVDGSIEDYVGLLNQEQEGYIFDPELMRFELTDDGFLVMAYVKDVVSESEYDVLELSLMMAGFSASDISESVIHIAYSFTEDTMIRTETMIFNMASEPTYMMEIEVTQTISTSAFEEVNFNLPRFHIVPADAFNEVVEVTDLSVPLTGAGLPKDQIYKVYLEEGQYFVNDFYSNLNVTFYNMNGVKLNLDKAPDYRLNFDLEYAFISNPGYYFVEVDWQNTSASDGYKLSLDLLDYETIFNPLQAETLSNGVYEFISEGEHDFVAVKYLIYQPTLIKIQPEVDTDLLILYEDEEFQVYNDSRNDPIYITIQPGKPLIYLHAFDEVTVNLNIEIIDASYYKTNDLNQMTEMTSEYSEKPIYVSEALGKMKLKLVVEEKAYYTIHYETIEGLNDPNAYIKTLSGANVSNEMITYNDGIVLEPGIYVVEFSVNYWYGGGKVKYESIIYEAEVNVDLELGETAVLNPYDDSFPSSEYFYFLDKEQVYNGWFTLTESEIIFIGGVDFKLFNDQDEMIGVHYVGNYFNGTYFRLNAGTYYVQYLNAERGYSRYANFQVAIYTGELDDDYVYGTAVPVLISGTEVTTHNDGLYDTELFKFTITEQQTVTITGPGLFTVYIYDENGEYANAFHENTTMSLNTGKYYVYVFYAYSSVEQIRFSITYH